MTFVITEPCVDILDKSCVEVCPVDCIYTGDRMLYIQPDDCVECGACVPACPMDAIFDEVDLPERWSDFKIYSVELFSEVGSPGGAAEHGNLGRDHAAVRGLQARPIR